MKKYEIEVNYYYEKTDTKHSNFWQACSDSNRPYYDSLRAVRYESKHVS